MERCINKQPNKQVINRINEEKYNNQGCLMKIVIYNNTNDIIVEFQDKYRGRVHTNYQAFSRGGVKNPYYPTVYGAGMIGTKYKMKINGKDTKEYKTWIDMLKRCFNTKRKQEHPTYKNVTCCSEWLLYENFYDWLHNQENFKKWLDGDMWTIDKDILIKGNKIYSPETCCLVPQNVNKLFTKRDAKRGNLPIGVIKNGNGFRAECMNPFTKKKEYSTTYSTIKQSFQKYKCIKEDIIQQVAQIEFLKGNITKRCYEAMMNYKVEITD